MSSDINAQIFYVNSSKLLRRMNPSAYKKQFRFSSTQYPVYKLRELAYVDPSVHFDVLRNQEEISFVPMECIDETSGTIVSKRKIMRCDSKGYTRFEENDILWAKITPCMQNAKSTIARELINGQGCGSTEFYVIRPKVGNLLPEYLLFLLRDKRILDSAKNFFGGTAGQQRVAKDFLLDFDIPLPPIDVQHKIINILFNANTANTERKKQAKELLDSIDSYLLNELCIVLPEQDCSLENRCFIRKHSELHGQLFAPQMHSQDTHELKRAIANSHYEKFRFADLIVHSSSGEWGESDLPVDQEDEYTRCLVIRSTEFDNRYNLNINGDKAQYRYIRNKKLESMSIRHNDILIEKSGGSPDQPVGRVAILTDAICSSTQIAYSNFIHKIRINENIVLPYFIFYYMKTMHRIKLTETMQSQTNGIRNLIMNMFLKQQIPIPPFDVQKRIVDYICKMQTKAKELEFEATQILDDVKKQIEKMIIGE